MKQKGFACILWHYLTIFSLSSSVLLFRLSF